MKPSPKLWAIYTPSGRLCWETIHTTKRGAWARAEFPWFPMPVNIQEAERRGYTCQEVEVRPV